MALRHVVSLLKETAWWVILHCTKIELTAHVSSCLDFFYGICHYSNLSQEWTWSSKWVLYEESMKIVHYIRVYKYVNSMLIELLVHTSWTNDPSVFKCYFKSDMKLLKIKINCCSSQIYNRRCGISISIYAYAVICYLNP